MKLQNLKNYSPKNPLFKGATININALSDTHGHIEKTDCAYQSLIKCDAFEKEEQGKANYLIIGGDWFISGGKKGFLSNPDKPLAVFQRQMLNAFLAKIKNKFPKTTALFVLGNHDFDSDREVFIDSIKNTNIQFLASNLNYNDPEGIDKVFEEGKIIESKIDFIEDDKDPNVRHALLNLGVIPVNLKYYQNNFNEINLIDNSKIAQKFIKPQDFKKTKQAILKKVNDFKKQYPNGNVVLTCHTGANFADACAREGNIDLIFDGHEHKKSLRYVNNTPIVELNQNFQKIANAKIIKNDDGTTSKIKIESFNPMEQSYIPSELSGFYQKIFSKDLEKIYTIKSDDKTLKELSINDVRSKNNHLANFIVDIILEKIKQKDNSVQIFALNASSIRSGFTLDEGKNTSHYEILNCLNGLNPKQADILTTSITGEELVLIVLDNYLFNQIDKEKNPIFHYAGLTINKTKLLEEYKKGVSLKDLSQYIILEESKQPIDPDKTYKIANVEKYFDKSKNEKIKAMKNRSQRLNLKATEVFIDYFKTEKEITFTPKTRLY